jgi:hypothetical protein
MSDDVAARLDHLARLREEIFSEMEAAESEMAGVRVRVERLESDQRLGGAVTPEYEKLKGHALPQLETRVVEAYNSLLKIERKILDTRRGAGALC